MHDESSKLQEQRQAALGCWYLSGSTATGKTLVSLELAGHLNAEIVLLDSMTVYREMDIGTAKPLPEQLASVPHHLINICDPTENFSVSRYRDLALEKISEIASRGKTVLFVGGSALYLKALLRGLFDGPEANWEYRKEIEREAELVGIEQLHERLAVLDPVTAHKLHVNDRRRIIRALEVFQVTGRPMSHWQMEFDMATPREMCRVFCLRRPRPELHERIEQRVREMFESGFVDEVRGLLEKWSELSRTASQAVGYCEIIAHINGQMELEQTMERVLIRTRRFARHQETWFRNTEECRIIDIAENDTPKSIVAMLLEKADSSPNRPL